MPVFTEFERPAVQRPQTRRALSIPARLVFDVSFVLLTVALIFPIVEAPMSGDYLQWVMVSRFFSGERLPSYRDISAVAPLVPALLALVRVVVHDPIVALQVLRVVSLVALAIGLYTAGAAMFRSRGAGLLSVVFTFSFTERFLELFAFGALLQLASLALMMMGIAALARVTCSARHERLWWMAASTAFSLAVLSHAGSVAVVVPVGLATGLVALVATRKRRSPMEWVAFLQPVVVLPAVAMAYWLLILLPANQGYADNPATLQYRGPDRLFSPLLQRDLTVFVMVAGFFALSAGLAFEAWKRRIGGYVMLAAWTAATWGVLGITIATGTATDYPRFAGPILAPLIVGAAAGAADLLRWYISTLRGPASDATSPTAAILAVAGIVLFFGGSKQLNAFQVHAHNYGLSDQGSIESFASWIEDHLSEDQSIAMLEARDGKWIEGLTGRDALFANETRYSYREVEWARTVAADALIRSTTEMVNGLVSAKFMTIASTGHADVPRELLFGVNHDGEWIDLLRAPEYRSRIIVGGPAGSVARTLGSLDPVEVQRIQTPEAVVVRTTWSGSIAGRPITWRREVSLTRGSDVVDVVDQVDTAAALTGIEIELSSYNGRPYALSQLADGSAALLFRRYGARHPEVAVRLVDGGRLEVSDDALMLRSAGNARLHYEVEALTPGAPISDLLLLDPAQLMEDYNVGAAILRKDGALEPRLRRLQALGMCQETETDSYVLLGLDCPPAGDQAVDRSGAADPPPGGAP